MSQERLKSAIVIYGIKKDKTMHLLSVHTLSLGQSPDIMLNALIRDAKLYSDLSYEKIFMKLERMYLMDK